MSQKPADIGSKRLVSLAPDGWVKWLMQSQDIEFKEFLSSDFQWISRDSDLLLKAYSRKHGEFLILNELQLQYRRVMPRRVRAYTALAEEKFNLPVYPILVHILKPTPGIEIATRYESEFMGIYARQDYRLINMWEVDVELAFQPALKPLLPFAPVLKGGGSESVVRRAVQLLEADEKLSELKNLLGYFATFVLSTTTVQEIMNWEMMVFRESPLGQDILQTGKKEGVEETLLRQIGRRFGEIPESVQATLQGLSLEKLEDLAEELVEVNSLEEFISSIPVPAANGSAT